MRTTRPTRTLLAVGALVAAILVGPGAGGAAAARHAPCPTAGVTVLRATLPNVRVWRQAGTLRACLREPGTRRRIRALGPWRPGTRVVARRGAVAWTTPRRVGDATVDGVATVDLYRGARWLRTEHAVPAGPSSPARDDRVLRLITDDGVTAWVTAGGTVAAAVRALDTEHPATLDDAPVAAVGRRFLLAAVDPATAAATAKGLYATTSGDTDDCGGETRFHLRFPAPDAGGESIFTYRTDVVVPDRAICS